MQQGMCRYFRYAVLHWFPFFLSFEDLRKFYVDCEECKFYADSKQIFLTSCNVSQHKVSSKTVKQVISESDAAKVVTE